MEGQIRVLIQKYNDYRERCRAKPVTTQEQGQGCFNKTNFTGGYENRTRLPGWETAVSSPETTPNSEGVKIFNFIGVGNPAKGLKPDYSFSRALPFVLTNLKK